MLSSSLNAAALLVRFCEERYAMMDLCLKIVSSVAESRRLAHSSSACRDVRIWLMAIVDTLSSRLLDLSVCPKAMRLAVVR